jgi:cobalt/nickel transport system permease protein
MYVAATPFWGIASARVRRTIGGRTIPLLAIFSAFTFAIMMFNVPVPGGTTAHGVGGTLTAIVIGPWAAVISTSVALVVQALFFGDGGITAIGANCFNMGVVLPMAGYVTYRVIAGRSDALSQRRVVAAAIGAYVGITMAALLVGIELGIQPHFWSTNGVPDYSPYGLETAIPAMLVAHLLGASFVEGAITALAVSYLQRSYPEILLRQREASADVRARSRALNPWITGGAIAAVSFAVIFVAGLIKGGGDLGDWAGLDWSTVDWSAAAGSVAVSAVISAVLLPAIYYALRRRRAWRAPVLVFVAIVIWVPVGLIAPGSAFAEDQSVTPQELQAALSARAAGDSSLFDALPDVNQECECVPSKINDVTYAQHAVLGGYQPSWVSADAPAWQQNLGYQFAGLAGIGGLAVLAFIVYRIARWLAPAAPPDWRTAE